MQPPDSKSTNSDSHPSRSHEYPMTSVSNRDQQAPASHNTSTKSQDLHGTSRATRGGRDVEPGPRKSQLKFVRCRNLVTAVTTRDLYHVFSDCDDFVVVEMQFDTRRNNKGVAYIKFQSAEGAKKAMDELKGTKLRGRDLSMALVARSDHIRNIEVNLWGDRREEQFRDAEISRINNLLAHKAETFAPAYVDFMTMVKRDYPGDSSVRRKQRIFENFKITAADAYQRLVDKRPLITSVKQLMLGRTTLSPDDLAALFYHFINFIERMKDMRYLKKLWGEAIRLGGIRDGEGTLRVYKTRNLLTHIMWGGLYPVIHLRPIYQCLHEDIDGTYDEFKELARRWDECFEQVMSEERNPNNEDERHVVQESFYDESA